GSQLNASNFGRTGRRADVADLAVRDPQTIVPTRQDADGRLAGDGVADVIRGWAADHGRPAADGGDLTVQIVGHTDVQHLDADPAVSNRQILIMVLRVRAERVPRGRIRELIDPA